MADPLIPGGVRAQVVLQSTTGLPEDRFVQTFAFGAQDAGTPTDGELDTLAARLEAVYTTAASGSTAKLEDFFPPYTTATINLYLMGDTPPREPNSYEFDVSPGASNGYPAEVALCLSHYSTRNLPSFRGRTYFGPFGTGGSTASGFAEGDIRPSANLQTVLLQVWERLSDPVVTDNLPLAICSQVDGVLRLSTNAWVDNAWDTQRRRGVRATSRLTRP